MSFSGQQSTDYGTIFWLREKSQDPHELFFKSLGFQPMKLIHLSAEFLVYREACCYVLGPHGMSACQHIDPCF